MRERLHSLEEIKARLLARAPELALKLGISARTRGNQLWMLNPHFTTANWTSFSLNLRTGVWKDFVSGQGGGDCLALIAEFACAGRYKSERTEDGAILKGREGAVDWARDFLGLTGRAPDPAETKKIAEAVAAANAKNDDSARRRRAAAFAIFCDARPLDGNDPASLYLRARGIDVKKLDSIPRSLRFHPRVLALPEQTWHPAMVAALSLEGLPHGFAAVHKTYLCETKGVWRKHEFAPFGGAEMSSKRVLGSYRGATIRLVIGASGKKLKDAPRGEWVATAEGIENALTVALARPSLRTLAAGMCANLGGMILPAQLGGVYVIADNDAKPAAIRQFESAIERLTERHAVAIVRMPENFKDANDALRGIQLRPPGFAGRVPLVPGEPGEAARAAKTGDAA